jgi:tetratricopeptide (TPR) repeat protein
MDSPLVVFIAMPGSDMGQHAAWQDIAEIKLHLYDPIARQLEAELSVRVDIHIEKDKVGPGGIHRSMFKEALQAPVYVADLTGANANVYLELGVRWSLRDHVTVLVCQNVAQDVKFNVAPNRVIPYGRGPSQLEAARRDIVRAIAHGMTSNQVDSPVREDLGVISVSRAEVDQLRAKLAKLQQERGDELVAAAESATYEERVKLLKRAIEINPANARAHFQLGDSFLAAGEYEQALNYLTRATQLNPQDADSWRQLSAVYSRTDDLDKAIEALQKAINLNPSDAEAWSVLGGVYRRQARNFYDRTGEYDWETFRLARNAYDQAGQLNQRDTYPLFNVARLDLLLSRGDAAAQAKALEQFRNLEHLAWFAVRTEGDDDPWKWLDLADALVINGKADEAVDASRRGLSKFDPAYQETAAESALAPLRDFLNVGCLPEAIVPAVRALVSEYGKLVA